MPVWISKKQKNSNPGLFFQRKGTGYKSGLARCAPLLTCRIPLKLYLTCLYEEAFFIGSAICFFRRPGNIFRLVSVREWIMRNGTTKKAMDGARTGYSSPFLPYYLSPTGYVLFDGDSLWSQWAIAHPPECLFAVMIGYFVNLGTETGGQLSTILASMKNTSQASKVPS
jgi:hypothetical protein